MCHYKTIQSDDAGINMIMYSDIIVYLPVFEYNNVIYTGITNDLEEGLKCHTSCRIKANSKILPVESDKYISCTD